jgi:hypothetical protein
VPPWLEELRCSKSQFHRHQEALSVSPVSHGIDRIGVTFDEPNLVANPGLLLVATLTQRGTVRFVEELVARVRRAGATGELIMRFDSGFWSNTTIATLERLEVGFTKACG